MCCLFIVASSSVTLRDGNSLGCGYSTVIVPKIVAVRVAGMVTSGIWVMVLVMLMVMG